MKQHGLSWVLVTGANRNIGAHLAHRLLDDGFSVIAHYRHETNTIAELQAKGAEAVQADLTHIQTLPELAASITAIAPGLRAVIHNASTFEPTSDDPDDAAAQFQTFFDVHMRAPFLLNRYLEGSLRRADGVSDIIQITDIYADNPAPEYATYCATKAGLQNLALSLARQLAPSIKVNVIQPGPISFKEWRDDRDRERILDDTPLGTTGSAEAIYIALRAIMANPYQTGAVIPVDGGRRLGRSH